MRKLSVSLAILLALIKPCFADPIPAQHTQYPAVLLISVILNYVWNLCFLGITFKVMNLKLKPSFVLYILLLTVFGLIVDALSFFPVIYVGADNPLGYILWISLAGMGLFVLAFLLTKNFFGLNSKTSAIVGLVYATISNPAIGVGVILPLLRSI